MYCHCEREDLGYRLPDTRARYIIPGSPCGECEMCRDGEESDCDAVINEETEIKVQVRREYGTCPDCGCNTNLVDVRGEVVIDGHAIHTAKTPPAAQAWVERVMPTARMIWW